MFRLCFPCVSSVARISIDLACASRPSAAASAMAAGPIARSPRRSMRCTVRHARSRRRSGRRGTRRAAGRQHVVRAGDVVAERLRAPPPTKMVPARVNRRATPAPSQTTCSGAMRWHSAIASLDRTRHDDCAVPRSAPLAAGPSRRQRALHCAATARRAVGEGVTKIARAAGSCSACAIRSAAIQSGRPFVDTTTISLGPAKKVDRAVARHQRLRRGDPGVAGADDLVDARETDSVP